MANFRMCAGRWRPKSNTCKSARMRRFISCDGMTPPGAVPPHGDELKRDMLVPISQDVRKLLAFGSGIGIEIGPSDLEVAAARVRPSRVQVVGRWTIRDYASRPAAEWGGEYARLV